MAASSGGTNLMSLTYGYSASQNNGNVLNQSISQGTASFTQSYGYDGVNRLQSASESGVWGQTYVYDKAGNRAVLTGSTLAGASNLTPQTSSTTSVPYDSANRWLGTSYDGAGNLTGVSTKSFVYDAENRQIVANDSVGPASATYTYDGDGRRVTKTVNGVTTIFVYDPLGRLAAEYAAASTLVAGTKFLTGAGLGSTRLVTGASGQVMDCHDYLPFGEESPAS